MSDQQELRAVRDELGHAAEALRDFAAGEDTTSEAAARKAVDLLGELETARELVAQMDADMALAAKETAELHRRDEVLVRGMRNIEGVLRLAGMELKGAFPPEGEEEPV